LKCSLQQGNALVIQHVSKHQHGSIIEVCYGLQLVGVSEQHTLTCVCADYLAVLGTALSCIKTQLHGICQLSLQRPVATKGNVIDNLTKCGDNGLTHGWLCREHTHYFGVALKGFADEHVFQELTTDGTQFLLSANTVNHFCQLCLWNNTGIVQVIDCAKARFCIVVEVAQRVISVDGSDNTLETIVAHGLAKFHGLLGLVLRLHFLLVELRKGLCRVWHCFIGNE